jgi:hypothetical protein
VGMNDARSTTGIAANGMLASSRVGRLELQRELSVKNLSTVDTFTLKKGAIGFSQTLVSFYQAIRRNIQEDSNLEPYRPQKLRKCVVTLGNSGQLKK